jgi:hypothetical protein
MCVNDVQRARLLLAHMLRTGTVDWVMETDQWVKYYLDPRRMIAFPCAFCCFNISLYLTVINACVTDWLIMVAPRMTSFTLQRLCRNTIRKTFTHTQVEHAVDGRVPVWAKEYLLLQRDDYCVF